MKRSLILLVLLAACAPRVKTDLTNCRFLYTDYVVKNGSLIPTPVYACKEGK